MSETTSTFEPAFADLSYNKKKVEMATRVAENREKRLLLEKELNEYKRIEKHGKMSLEDPSVRAEILKLQETINLETKYKTRLEEEVTNSKEKLIRLESQIKELSDLIQKRKEQEQLGSFDESLFIESRLIQLQDREKELTKIIQSKKARLEELKKEFDKISMEIAKKSLQDQLFEIIVKWKEGKKPEEDEIQKLAYNHFTKAREAYMQAKEAKDAELLPLYYQKIQESLHNAIDCVYVLTFKDTKSYPAIPYIEKVDQLFTKKIVINPVMLEKLDNLVQKQKDGIDIRPNMQFDQDIWEYLIKNLKSVRII